MSDASGFMVAAYLLTAAVLVGYAVVLSLRARAAERRLAELREESQRTGIRAAPRELPQLEAVGGSRVQA